MAHDVVTDGSKALQRCQLHELSPEARASEESQETRQVRDLRAPGKAVDRGISCPTPPTLFRNHR